MHSKQKWEKLSPRQSRQLEYISQFSVDIRHISGNDNVVADTLSRINTISVPSAIDVDKLSDAQFCDEELLRMLESSTSGFNLQYIPLKNGTKSIICDTSTGKMRPCLPPSFRREAFERIHNLSHPGTRATCNIMTDKFVWPNIKAQVREWKRSCIRCQQNKVQRHTRAAIEKFRVPNQRFEHINIDIIGPLPPSEGFVYCLTCDSGNSRPYVILRMDIKIWSLKSYNYRPRPAVRKQLIGTARKTIGGTALPYYCVSSCLKSGIEVSRFERLGSDTPDGLTWNSVYGQSLRLPGEFFETSAAVTGEAEFVRQLRSHFEQLKPTATSQHGEHQIWIPKNLMLASHVFLRDDKVRLPLKSIYDGPYEVLHRGERHSGSVIKARS